MKDIGTTPTAIGGMTESELDAELAKGIESLKKDRGYSIDEVDFEIESLFEIIPDDIPLEEAIEERRNKI